MPFPTTEKLTSDCDCDLDTDNDMMDEDSYENITVLSPISQYVPKNITPRSLRS